MPTFDERIAIILPVYSKYYTVAEIQNLIKLYSTEDMLNMSKRDDLINEELNRSGKTKWPKHWTG